MPSLLRRCWLDDRKGVVVVVVVVGVVVGVVVVLVVIVVVVAVIVVVTEVEVNSVKLMGCSLM